MNPLNLLRIWWARLLRREAVVLQDWKNNIYHSQAVGTDDPTQLQSWVFCWFKIGPIILRENGAVSKSDGTEHFVERWVYLDRTLRVEQILKGAEGFKF
jgi:hypothetical protein